MSQKAPPALSRKGGLGESLGLLSVQGSRHEYGRAATRGKPQRATEGRPYNLHTSLKTFSQNVVGAICDRPPVPVPMRGVPSPLKSKSPEDAASGLLPSAKPCLGQGMYAVSAVPQLPRGSNHASLFPSIARWVSKGGASRHAPVAHIASANESTETSELARDD